MQKSLWYARWTWVVGVHKSPLYPLIKLVLKDINKLHFEHLTLNLIVKNHIEQLKPSRYCEF